MLKKINARPWDANGRAKVGQIVTYNNAFYLNKTGINSNPEELTDWVYRGEVLRTGFYAMKNAENLDGDDVLSWQSKLGLTPYDQDLNIGSNVQFNQVKSQLSDWWIGQTNDYKAELFLLDQSNSNFPNKSFSIRANIGDGFSTYNYSGSAGGQMEVTSAGTFLNYFSTGGNFQLKINSAGILGQAYYAPSGDFHFVQKKYVDDKVASVYKIKGSVAKFAALPISGQMSGDVWNLISTGENYVWVLDLNNTGTPGWDKFSGVVDLTGYVQKAGDTMTGQLTINSGTNNPFNFNGTYNKFKADAGTTEIESYHSTRVVINSTGSSGSAYFSISQGASYIGGGTPAELFKIDYLGAITAKGIISTQTKGTSANWYDAFLWGDHKSYNTGQYLGSNYTGGGAYIPSTFGGGKLVPQMLYGTDMPGTGLGTDFQNVLYLSGYDGVDTSANKSVAIVSSMATNNIGFVKQSNNAAAWGTYIPFWTGANFDPETKADKRNYTTSEVDTKIKWIDNKPIYQKTLSLTSIPSNGIVDITALVPNLKLITNVKVFTDWGVRDIAFAGQVYRAVVSGDITTDITLSITPYDITIYDSAADTGYDAISKITVTLEYTKTTD